MTIPIVPIKAKRKKKKLADLVQFGPKAKPPRPSETMPKEEEKEPRGPAAGLARAAMAMPGRGTAGRILKGAVAGAAAGAELEESYRRYKKERAKSKAKKATTTVTQSAMAQKARYHKKDPTSTKRT